MTNIRLGWLASLSIVLTLFSLLNLVGGRGFLFEINSTLGGYYLFSHIALVFLAVFWPLFADRSRRRLWIAVQITLITYYVLPAAKFYIPFHSDLAESKAYSSRLFSVLYANVHRKEYSIESLGRLIAQSNPDMVGLVEVDIRWIDGLSLASNYPFKVEMPHEEDDFGVALYSRFPILSSTDLGVDVEPAINAKLDIGLSKPLQAFLFHCTAPISQARYLSARRTLRRSATIVRQGDSPVLVIGDFNMSPWSESYQQYLGWTKLRNASEGFGLMNTWNAKFPLFRFMFDHFLINDQVSTDSINRLENFGSDHYGVFANFSVRP